MMKRLLAIAVVIALVAVAVWWAWLRPTRTSSPTSTSTPAPEATSAAAPRSPLAIRIALATGAPGSSAAITVRLFNQLARQAALDRDAATAAPLPAGVAPPAPVPPVRLQFSSAEWLDRLTFVSLAADGTTTRLPGIFVRAAPTEAVDLDASATITVVIECPADALPRIGSSIVATYRAEEGALDSNPVTVEAAPASGLPTLNADARVARLLGDVERLDRAATAIATTAPGGVEAPYYRGLVQEARGDKTAALASYKQALERIGRTPRFEPPDELIMLIRRLEPPKR